MKAYVHKMGQRISENAKELTKKETWSADAFKSALTNPETYQQTMEMGAALYTMSRPVIGEVSVNVGATGSRGANLVSIGTIEDDVMMFSAKIGKETVEGISNFAVKDGKLYLNQLHLQGSSAGSVGRQSLWDIAKDLGKQ